MQTGCNWVAGGRYPADGRRGTAGKAAWFLLIAQLAEDKFLAEITNAKVVRSNLTEQREKQLKEAYGA